MSTALGKLPFLEQRNVWLKYVATINGRQVANEVCVYDDPDQSLEQTILRLNEHLRDRWAATDITVTVSTATDATFRSMFVIADAKA